MQTKKPNIRRPIKFIDSKILITTVSMAVAVGLWNLFSSNAVQVEKASNLPATPPSGPNEVDGLPALPTLVPLISISDQAVSTSPENQAAPGTPAEKLRSVSSPDQTVVQKNRPVIDQPGVVVVVSGGGSQGVTSTRSSR